MAEHAGESPVAPEETSLRGESSGRRCPLCTSSEHAYERTLNGIDLVRCASCGMVFASMSAEEIEAANARIFAEDSGYASDYEWKQSELDASWFDALARRFTSRFGPARVLDIGCGNGRLLTCFQSLGWSCVGLDPSPWSRRWAESIGFELLNGFPEDFHERRESFDLAISTSTLEHVAEPKRHVQSIMDFVRPGGRVYLCGIPNYGSWSVRARISSFFANKPPMHVNYFTPRTLGALIASTSPAPSSYRIRTYGIPELHKVLYRARKKNRSLTKQNLRSRNRHTPPAALSRLAVEAYYWAGAPLGLGDKLEAEVLK